MLDQGWVSPIPLSVAFRVELWVVAVYAIKGRDVPNVWIVQVRTFRGGQRKILIMAVRELHWDSGLHAILGVVNVLVGEATWTPTELRGLVSGRLEWIPAHIASIRHPVREGDY